MKKKQKEIPGGIVKIQFDTLFHTYGRILNYGDVALYDKKADKDINDLEEIIRSPIIYKMIVNIGAIERGRWPIIGIIPLEKELQNSKYYLEEIGHPDLCKIKTNGNTIYNRPKEEAAGLEVGAIWDALHVEEFLRDHYAGRENISLKQIDVFGNYKFNTKSY
ncbi:Imm26 family immunity protein [Mucilaginibacter auburnensis]|uniref:Immunity protein 26 of polymorphic toxin system n=1 Tax=Mucilaginibacter auburnensis TaxID=1457233 RepID=A0A2H9VPN6_9SPHI|nr:Imm26 family immunity protein [Mucilaginibacter auburnensis]PJJ80286.1 immunity protein 26 of polymorphic toxin system [Mucilaginibacter auburnensis]